MANPLHILCPGQGAQAVGMGKDLCASSGVAKKFFDDANAIVGFDLAGACFAGPEEKLNQTDISQPAIYVTSIASYHAGLAAKVFAEDEVTSYAGLSLGEYTALHLAGVFSFEQGLKLVAARGRYMQEAAVATPSGMVAIMGADEAAIRKLCEENAGGEVLVPANFNAPGQVVVSGTLGACDRVLKAAEAGGFKAVALKVAGAFHSPLMQSGADRMKDELDRAAFAEPKKTVYSNVTGKPHGMESGGTDTIKKLLVEQITHPVRWQQNMEAIIASGEARYLELAPGRTLAGLAKRINRRLPVESMTEKLATPAA